MARRNPTNQRYLNDKPAGKTRKSAAAAKPKRSAADSSSTKPTGKTAAKGSARKPAASVAARLHPTTPEYRRWRTIWFVLLGIAMVLATVSWWLWRSNEKLGLYVLVAAYASIGFAIWVDWAKMRPLRAAWIESGEADKAEKLAIAAKAEADAEKARKAEAKAAEKAQRKADSK